MINQIHIIGDERKRPSLAEMRAKGEAFSRRVRLEDKRAKLEEKLKSEESLPKKRILIVDNDSHIRSSYAYAIKNNYKNFLIEECEQDKVFDYLDETYALILLDSDFGKGKNTLEKIRQKNENIPVIYSSHDDHKEFAESYNAEFFKKSMELKDLYKLVEKHIGEKSE